ncbi:hypothetical protein MUG91_G103n92 [Manis pentadactyla]|nr:hypothetical protein MUG91_G103n92 [Manis pentadactyla]
MPPSSLQSARFLVSVLSRHRGPPAFVGEPRSGVILGACAPHVPDGTTVLPALPFQAVVFLQERREGQQQAGSEGWLPEAPPADGLALHVPDEENWNSNETRVPGICPRRMPAEEGRSEVPAFLADEEHLCPARPLAPGTHTQAGGLQPTFPTNTSIPRTSGHTAMEKKWSDREHQTPVSEPCTVQPEVQEFTRSRHSPTRRELLGFQGSLEHLPTVAPSAQRCGASGLVPAADMPSDWSEAWRMEGT